jgi:hypothetical protein
LVTPQPPAFTTRLLHLGDLLPPGWSTTVAVATARLWRPWKKNLIRTLGSRRDEAMLWK